MIKINEIFFSIQGESSLAGYPTVFIRTSGCNLRCHYCDTQYAYHEGAQMSLDAVLSKVHDFGARFVCLTGGEPLLQPSSPELLRRLCDLGYQVSLETSGERPVDFVDKRVKKILDVKTPDSGAANTFRADNLSFITDNDELKFVICSQRDFEWCEDFLRSNDLIKHPFVFYSPSHGNVEAKWLAEQILLKKSPARLHLQLHKYIWSPGARGV